VERLDTCTVDSPDTTLHKEETKQEETEQEEDLDELRKKYIGEVDLPESASGCSESYVPVH
jgi:hypothetical protein